MCQYYKKKSRESFLTAAWSGLFISIDKQLSLKMLFSVPKCLGLADLTSFFSDACDSDLGRLVPLRHTALFDHNLMPLSECHAWVVIFLNKAGFKPTKVCNIQINEFTIDINSHYIRDLSVLVSAVDTVEIENQTTLSIIKAICMNKRPALRSLTVRGDNFTQMCISLLL